METTNGMPYRLHRQGLLKLRATASSSICAQPYFITIEPDQCSSQPIPSLHGNGGVQHT
jgi:hypothetical protein